MPPYFCTFIFLEQTEAILKKNVPENTFFFYFFSALPPVGISCEENGEFFAAEKARVQKTALVPVLSSIYGSERWSKGECPREEKVKNSAARQDAEGEIISGHKLRVPCPHVSPGVRGHRAFGCSFDGLEQRAWKFMHNIKRDALVSN